MHRRSRAGRVPVTLAALLGAVGRLAGCEERRRDAPAADAPAATLTATADYGSRELLATRVAPGGSVMRATRGATDVETAYAGAFVESMLGLGSDRSGTRDWFFYVNGLVSSVGAKEVRLRDGDAVWWDHRFWGDLQEAPAVVGAWPAPWALPDGRGPEVAADPPLDATLREAGAPVTGGAPVS